MIRTISVWGKAGVCGCVKARERRREGAYGSRGGWERGGGVPRNKIERERKREGGGVHLKFDGHDERKCTGLCSPYFVYV